MEVCSHISKDNVYSAILECYSFLQQNTGNLICCICKLKKPELWICISPDCLEVFCCDRGYDEECLHNYQHFKENETHYIHLNCMSKSVYCYLCAKECKITNNTSESYVKNCVVEKTPTKPTGLYGIQNTGNTCYMNSALQALSNTPPLTDFFLNCFLNDTRNQSHNMNMSTVYYHFIKKMWRIKCPENYVSANVILNLMRDLYPMFSGRHQHDTQEFLRYFMIIMNEELQELEVAPIICHSNKIILQKQTVEESQLTISEDDNDACSNNEESKFLERTTSIISQIFDGKVINSIQCLSCNQISTRVEIFQDLSLPIPICDQNTIIPQKHSTNMRSIYYNIFNIFKMTPFFKNWIFRFWHMIYKWIWKPKVSLQDCLSMFFSVDELKDDNMYSCEKCEMLCNGITFSKFLMLPEVLCIHLKRFRQNLSSSSKITLYVTFPIDNLNLQPYAHIDCTSKVTKYKLISVICHQNVNGSMGHYTCYSLNSINEQWYEFNDKHVTLVSAEIVRNSEAYILFYKKNSPITNTFRTKARQMQFNMIQPNYSKEACFISTRWWSKFNTFAEPGPINNYSFLCRHNKLKATHESKINHHAMMISSEIWDYLHNIYGGGPKCTNNQLKSCEICYITD